MLIQLKHKIQNSWHRPCKKIKYLHFIVYDKITKSFVYLFFMGFPCGLYMFYCFFVSVNRGTDMTF